MVLRTRFGLTSGNKIPKPTPNTNTTSTDNNVDRLSALPDELLISILTHLPTETALSTSALSHRWQTLWTRIPNLSFTGPHTPNLNSATIFTVTEYNVKFNDFIETVHNVLTHLTSPKLFTFHLTMDFPRDPYLTRRYNLLLYDWVTQVCSRHPEDISVILRSLADFGNRKLTIPTAVVFGCNTLVSLYLGDLLYCEIPKEINTNELEINLPRLKKLAMALDSSNWKDSSKHNLFKRLFKSSCPLLEELRLKTEFSYQGYVDDLEIDCPNLKTLYLDAEAVEVTVNLKINAPKLETLSVITQSALFSFVSKPPRLERVEFEICDDMFSHPDFNFWAYIADALMGISSVRVFGFNGVVLEKMDSMEESLPVYENLAEIRITDFDFTNLADLFRLLKHCPNLEVLVLTMDHELNSVWEVPVFEPVCLFTKLRVLELKNICGSDYPLAFMKYMLGKESVLEKLVVGVGYGYGHREAKYNEEFCHELFSYPRNSSVREISFSGRRVTATSKNSVVVDEDSDS